METNNNIRMKLNRRRDGQSLSDSEVAKMTFDATQVAFNRIIELRNNNFIVITRDQRDADRLLNSDMTNKSTNKGYDLVAPLELRAKKTILIRKLDRHIGGRDASELKAEFES